MEENTQSVGLDSFDHVVVLMLENRSFDNLLGYLYPEIPPNAPLGKSYAGLSNINFTNPVPPHAVQPPDGSSEVAAHVHDDRLGSTKYFMPYPDPGEEYWHVNLQLFNKPDGGENAPYNLPPGTDTLNPSMKGFVDDYIAVWEETLDIPANYCDYRQMMGCFSPEHVPVMSTLAKEFSVFDHWFCSVPSQTWCNRAFWNAGTSWGHTINGPSESWTRDSFGQTLFNQIHETGRHSKLNWMVYSDNEASLTSIIHGGALSPYHSWPANHFPQWDQFYTDCANGKLPSYSFLEPRFWTPHNDMHPSTYNSSKYGKSNVGSVLLGEKLIWDVYNAIKNSNSSEGNNSQNTLLIITFDEHGGCFDHVPPTKSVISPDGTNSSQGFRFDRLGIRVPMIMVSANIAKNTIVNDVKDHTSFIHTMQKKWNRAYPGSFPPLGSRSKQASTFEEVFTAPSPRPASTWPTIPEPVIPEGFKEIDFSNEPLSSLQRSMLEGASALYKMNQPELWRDHSTIQTVGEAQAYLKTIPKGFGFNAPTEKPDKQCDPPKDEHPHSPREQKTVWEKFIAFFRRLFGGK